MMALYPVALLMTLAACPARPPAPSGEVLYRMTLVRAAPGRLLEVVGEIQSALAGARAARPDRVPLVLRHSQGDQWDLMVLAPTDMFAEVFERGIAAPGLVAWQEDEFVRGPDIGAFEGFATGGLYHVEMFVALPDRRGELVREREMENAYERALGRPTDAIFTREMGAAWDAFTIGAFRSWKHFAERDDIPSDKSATAARAAGFEGDEKIGPYLRSLIQTHHDTLATPVR